MSEEKINILLLEDDHALAHALSRAMENRGHQIHWAAELDTFEDEINSEKEYHLILMDLKLEQGTSLKLISNVRRNYPGAKIFVVTGYASIATTVEAIKQGADDYLPKPITADDILNNYYGSHEAEVAVTDSRLSPKRLEWEHIQRVLAENDGNISRTAKQLDMHRRTLQRKLQKKPTQ